MKRRQIVKIIEEICKENGYKLSLYSDEWIIVVENAGKKMIIPSYRFPNNDAGVSDLCSDKSGLSDFLTANEIPCIPHTFYWFGGKNDSLNDENGLAKILAEHIEKYKGVVIKPNNGTGGSNVFKITNENMIPSILQMFKGEPRMIAISPFVEIESEYRAIVQGDEIAFTFEKMRPTVIADGKKSFFDYIKESGLVPTADLLDYIPKKGEEVQLVWKHNLQGGAKPVLVENPPDELINLVERARKATGIKFASVDVVKTNGRFYILEINSGVMMEKFSSENELYYDLAKKTYKKAIEDYFVIKN